MKFLAALLLVFAASPHAQCPSKPKLPEMRGQPVGVENRAGAGVPGT